MAVKRPCQAAEPGSILVSEAVSDLIDRRFATAALPPRVMKGFAEPVPAFELQWR